jgi:hypothetical protein
MNLRQGCYAPPPETSLVQGAATIPCNTAFGLSPDGDSTLATWTVTGAKTPMIRDMSIFKSMDKMIAPTSTGPLAAQGSVGEPPSRGPLRSCRSR